MNRNYKILVVDDEQEIRSMVKMHLELEGYLVMTATEGREALTQLSNAPDLILLDINMQGMNGIDLCSSIRDYISCPILFLTARVSGQDKVNGFKAGGDDYITKPFDMEELLARIAAHLRREERRGGKIKGRFQEDLFIDYGGHRVTVKGNDIELSNKEFGIIRYLSMNAGQVFDREKIYEHLWGLEGNGDSSVVKEHIRRIRQKLSAYTDKEYIETVWGVGYRWKK